MDNRELEIRGIRLWTRLRKGWRKWASLELDEIEVLGAYFTHLAEKTLGADGERRLRLWGRDYGRCRYCAQ